MAINSIDIFDFVSMSEPPLLASEHVVRRTKPGVNSVTLQVIGVWADPFEVTTFATAPNITTAHLAYRAYNAIIGTGAVTLVWEGFPHIAFGLMYHVLEVKPIDIRSIVRGHGPGGNYFAHVECRWRLQGVQV